MKTSYLISFALSILLLSSCGHSSRNKHEESKAIDSCVVYKPLTDHITKCPNRKPKYIVIHYTAGSSSKSGKAESLYDVFLSKKASTDFAVDDKNIVQFNPDIGNYYCWSVGDSKKKSSSGASLHRRATNKNTINIEICSNLESGTRHVANHSGWSFSEASLDNAAKITKIIMKKYNIPIENVIRHYDVSGKVCPGVIGWNNEVIYNKKGKQTKEKSKNNKWKEFKEKLVE